MKLKHLIAAAGLAVSTLALAPVQVHAQDHAGHDHGAEKKSNGHGHEGKHEDLGTTEAGGLKLTAHQIGKVEAGKEGVFEIELGEGAKTPKAVRVWVGNASAEGSTKAKATKEGDGFEVHVEVPKQLSADARLWVEIQPETGAKVKASFDLKK